MWTSKVSFAAPPKSREDLEELAKKYLTVLCPEALLVPTYLDVIRTMDLLEPRLGIKFGVEYLPGGDEGITNPWSKTILIDNAVYEAAELGDGRARFTCCHEIGHLQHIPILKHIVRDGAPTMARHLNITVPRFQDPEWQANSFASAFLMPRTTVPDVFREGGVDKIMEVFGVSAQAAGYRVEVLRRLNYL